MDAGKEFKTFVFIFLMIALIWLFTGGPLRPSSKSGLFLDRPRQKAAERVKKPLKEITGQPSVSVINGEEGINTATLNARKAKESDPNKEYIEIRASKDNEKSLNITNWILEGKVGFDIAIKQGTVLYMPGQANPEQDVVLRPGEKAIVVTGRSPLGVGFRLNKCTGYFEQFQDFVPRLPKKCPLAEDEDLPNNLKGSCLDFIERINRCEVVTSLPESMSPTCQNYVSTKISYKSCVENHKSDDDFYAPEWRVYLNRNEELWKRSRETITLTDINGNLVDSKSY